MAHFSARETEPVHVTGGTLSIGVCQTPALIPALPLPHGETSAQGCDFLGFHIGTRRLGGRGRDRDRDPRGAGTRTLRRVHSPTGHWKPQAPGDTLSETRP